MESACNSYAAAGAACGTREVRFGLPRPAPISAVTNLAGRLHLKTSFNPGAKTLGHALTAAIQLPIVAYLKVEPLLAPLLGRHVGTTGTSRWAQRVPHDLTSGLLSRGAASRRAAR